MTQDEQCKLHSDMLVRMDERVKEMHKWTFGNGQPGAAGRLITIETQMNELKKPRQWPAVLAAICAVAMAILNFYVVSSK